MRLGRRSGDWAVPVTPEDRERARGLLLERLRTGELRYDEYERRMLKVERARWVGALYDATFGRARLPFGGSRWLRRRRGLNTVGLVVLVVLAIGSVLERGLLWGLAFVSMVLLLVNCAIAVQAWRYPVRSLGSLRVGGPPR